MSNLLAEMESDVKTPMIGDNSLKEMSDLCAEQVALEEEMRLIGRTTESESNGCPKIVTGNYSCKNVRTGIGKFNIVGRIVHQD